MSRGRRVPMGVVRARRRPARPSLIGFRRTGRVAGIVHEVGVLHDDDVP